MKYIRTYNENSKYDILLVNIVSGEAFDIDIKAASDLIKNDMIKWNPDYDCFTFDDNISTRQYIWTYLTAKGYRKI